MRRALLALPLLLVATAAPALAEPGSATRDGRTLSVSKATQLAADGEVVRVRGTGYDRSKGIYVAFCVDNGPGRVPTPCGGGADTEGRSGNSVWISDLPPAYGTGLAQPYGEGGSFDVQISVRAQLNDDVDCREVRCAVVTRNDHTRSEDRTQDVLVPVTFGASTPRPVAAAPRAERTPAAAAPRPTTAAPQGEAAPATSEAATAPTGLDASTGASTAPASAAPTVPRSAPTAVAGPASEPRQDVAARRPDSDGGGLGLLLLGGAVLFAGGGLTGRHLLRRRRRA